MCILRRHVPSSISETDACIKLKMVKVYTLMALLWDPTSLLISMVPAADPREFYHLHKVQPKSFYCMDLERYNNCSGKSANGHSLGLGFVWPAL